MERAIAIFVVDGIGAVLATVAATERMLAEGSGRGRRIPAKTAALVATRLEALRAFCAAVDTGLLLRMVPARRVEGT
jgi:hypothetical protein